MTIRFTLTSLLLHFSLTGAALVGNNQSAIANSPVTTASTSSYSLSRVEQQSWIALRLPFFKRRKNRKPPREEIIPTANPNSSGNSREYIFRAPTTIGQKQSTSYQVQVYGSDHDLLQQVQAIEPQAFLKGNLIQVGAFSQQKNAEELLQKLAMRGFWARIIVSK